ncbi:MAG TPA: YceI family protein [Candidatus Cybelea sp.]|nr:YceI family protein [Candidatus Cybelea sp.]
MLVHLALVCALLGAAPGPRAIDAAKSSAQFSVAHIWVERVTGTLPILSGDVSLEPGAVIPTSAVAVLDATHITTGEPDRDRSLESPDFFDAAKFPRWTFASTRVVPTGPAAFEMDGDITIHGVTQPEKLDVTVTGDPEHPEYRAKTQIDRHAFGMARTRLDPTIGSSVEITLDIVLK